MKLKNQLHQLVKTHRNLKNDVVFKKLKKRVIKEMLEAAEDGKEKLIVKLISDGERAYKDDLLNFLNKEGLLATSYSFSQTERTIKVTWIN